MTACLFIQPGTVPAIASDIVVSTESAGQLSENSRRPMSIALDKNSSLPPMLHARKNYFLSDNTCIAFAGSAIEAKRTLLDLQDHICVFENVDLPALQIAKHIDQNTEIKALISWANMSNLIFNADYRFSLDHDAKIDTYTSKIFGDCHGIGSGRQRILKMVDLIENEQFFERRLKKVIQDERRYFAEIGLEGLATEKDIIFKNSISINKLFLHQLNITNLISELMNLARPSFGGFYEGSYFNLNQNRWVRQKNHVIIFYEITDQTVNISDFAFAYNSGIMHGEILVVRRHAPVNFHLCYDIRADLDKIQNTESEFKNNWKPEEAVIVLFKRYDPKPVKWFMIPIPPEEIQDVSFDLENFSFGLKKALISKLIIEPLRAGIYEFA